MEPNLNSPYSLNKIRLCDDYVMNHIDKNAKIHHNLIKTENDTIYMTFWMKDNGQMIYKKIYHDYKTLKLSRVIEYNKHGDVVMDVEF
jgi:hypothetical protein